MSEERFKIYASVHLLFVRKNEILLLLRKNISSSGLYGLVAGHLDEGETITNAFVREAQEEVGITLDQEDIKITTVCHSRVKEKNIEYVQFYAVCKDWKGELKNMEPDKCGEIRFFPFNELPDNIVPYIKDAIPKVLDGVGYYEYGWEAV